MIPLLVRKLEPHEHGFVVATWKRDLEEQSERAPWRRGMTNINFWRLVNHAVDKVSIPSSSIFVGCHPEATDTPLCWIAVRKFAGLSTYETVYLYVRGRVRKDPELAANLQHRFVHEVGRIIGNVVLEMRSYNPFKELSR